MPHTTIGMPPEHTQHRTTIRQISNLRIKSKRLARATRRLRNRGYDDTTTIKCSCESSILLITPPFPGQGRSAWPQTSLAFVGAPLIPRSSSEHVTLPAVVATFSSNTATRLPDSGLRQHVAFDGDPIWESIGVPWTPSESWLMAVTSVLPRIVSEVFVRRDTSVLMSRGDAIITQSA
jgi:hypothetical protein